MIAKAYRLLHAVLNTALDDELIAGTPAASAVPGRHTPRSDPSPPSRRSSTSPVAFPARFRALLLLAAFTGLRYGELAAWRRTDLAPDLAIITVRAT
jgi:integrase